MGGENCSGPDQKSKQNLIDSVCTVLHLQQSINMSGCGFTGRYVQDYFVTWSSDFLKPVHSELARQQTETVRELENVELFKYLETQPKKV